MSIWQRIAEFVQRVSHAAASGLADAFEAVRTIFEGDPETRRRVAFSIAMIALSAKMAKADGVVTQDEFRAFRQIFDIPPDEERNVMRLYELARQDTAGYEVYARKLAGLCGSGQPGCTALEDVLDGLFHIAKADGLVHEDEVRFLRRVAAIFGFSAAQFELILMRHVDSGEADPFQILGLEPDAGPEEVRWRYRELANQHHPDRVIARGLPPEFISIANDRLAAINAAYAAITRGTRRRIPA